MSTPCCLAEPSATYGLGDLPKSYWKLYAAAEKLVEQIKQHIPRVSGRVRGLDLRTEKFTQLVLYEPDSKFTLMTNLPDADVEAVFYSQEGSSRVQPCEKGELSGKAGGGFPPRGVSMRIKIMQSRQLVEISRQVLAPAKNRGRVMNPSSKDSLPREEEGEWKKVVLVAPGGNIDTIDQTSLDMFERNGLERTRVFLATCRAVESGLVDAQEFPDREISFVSNSLSSVLVCKTLPVDQIDGNIPGEPESVNLTRKFGILRHPTASTASAPSMGWNKDPRGFPFEPPSLTREPGGFETRFMPSVGWCVRYTGPSGGAGRYRMMFFDGKTLEVDVDEECVELMDSIRDEVVRFVHKSRRSQTQSLSDLCRYKIRECSSKREIMEKMRAFKEFVSMFDDGGDTD
jgi:polo-like kinase 4